MRKIAFSLFKNAIKPFTGKGLYKIPGAYKVYTSIFQFLKPDDLVLTNIQNFKMYVNPKDKGMAHTLLTAGFYAKNETELLKKQLKPGMIVVDVGAHIGYISLLAAKIVGPIGKVYAFEPEPQNYQILLKNIKLNDLEEVIIPINKAVSGKEEITKLFLSEEKDCVPSFSEKNVKNTTNSIEVDCIEADSFLKNLGVEKVDFIKIDVQGAEGKVIAGLKETLMKNKPLEIDMEFWPYGLQNLGTNPPKLLKDLQKMGFEVKTISRHSKELLDLSIDEIVAYCLKQGEKIGQVNLWLTKR